MCGPVQRFPVLRFHDQGHGNQENRQCSLQNDEHLAECHFALRPEVAANHVDGLPATGKQGEGTEIYVEAKPGRCFYYDTGVGVPPEMLDKIFERFFRIPGMTGTDWNVDTGSGLGLSVVRNAVGFHGGEIKASLRPEGGLSFEMTLPLSYR